MQEILQSTLINIPVYVILCTCTGMTYDEFLYLFKYFILSLCTNVLYMYDEIFMNQFFYSLII